MERVSSSPGPLGGMERAKRERRGLPYWVATPFRLARFPAVLFAVAGAALVLVVATAAGPMFLSSAGVASLSRSLAQHRGEPALTVTGYGPATSEFLDPPDRALRGAAAGLPELGPPVLSVIADMTAGSSGPARQSFSVRMVSRTGFLSNIQASAGSGTGVWLTDQDAATLSVHAGDPITFREGFQTTTTTVAGTYRSLSQGRLPEFWVPLRDLIRGGTGEAPHVILADASTITSIGEPLRAPGRVQWDFPLVARSMSLPQAEGLAGRLQFLSAEVRDSHTDLGGSFQTAKYSTSTPSAATGVPDLVDEARNIVAAITGPVGTITLAGSVLAILGVAAAGVYGIRRRRVEASLMAARGVAAGIQGGTAAAEAAVPAVLGGAAGWFIALFLVQAFGPSRVVEGAAEQSAVAASAWTLLVAVILLGVAAAVTARLEFEEVSGRVPQLVARMPWEVLVLVLAAAAFYEIASRGSEPVSGGSAPHVDRLLLLFPLLFIAGLAGVAVRGVRALLVGLRTRGGRWRAPAFLAVRRLAAAPRIALLLVTASSLAVGILVYAGMVGASVTTTSAEKARVAVGSDVAAPLPASVEPSMLEGLPFPATVVSRIDQASVSPGTQAVEVLAIDPRTFPAAAFWDPAFAGDDLDSLLGRISTEGGLRVPVVVAGGDLTGDLVLNIPGSTTPLHVAGTANAFPGSGTTGRPVVVVDAQVLLRTTPAVATLAGRGRQVWAKGDPSTILPQLRQLGVPPSSAVTADEVERTPAFLAVSWTFSFLEALGIVAAMVALIGLILYLQSRQQSREVGYALATRMGLTRRAHRRSVGLELGGMLLAAFVIGAALAAGATRLLYRKLDVLPSQPPAPLFRLPVTMFGVVALTLLLAAVIGAAAVQRRASRANVAEVMRLAG